VTTLSLAPDSFTTLTVLLIIRSLAVLLAVLPVADVFAAIGPLEGALAMLFIIEVFSFVFPAVGPSEETSALHLVSVPLARVDTSIAPSVLAIALDVVVDEIASELGCVCPDEDSVAVLLALVVDACVLGTVGPRLSTIPVLFVFEPLAHVRSPIKVSEGTLTIGHVILPIAGVHVQISVEKTAFAASFIVFPVSLVQATIRPLNDTFALSDLSALKPFTSVLGSRLNGCLGACLSFAKRSLIFVLIVNKCAQVLSSCHDILVLETALHYIGSKIMRSAPSDLRFVNAKFVNLVSLLRQLLTGFIASVSRLNLSGRTGHFVFIHIEGVELFSHAVLLC